MKLTEKSGSNFLKDLYDGLYEMGDVEVYIIDSVQSMNEKARISRLDESIKVILKNGKVLYVTYEVGLGAIHVYGHSEKGGFILLDVFTAVLYKRIPLLFRVNSVISGYNSKSADFYNDMVRIAENMLGW